MKNLSGCRKFSRLLHTNQPKRKNEKKRRKQRKSATAEKQKQHSLTHSLTWLERVRNLETQQAIKKKYTCFFCTSKEKGKT